MEWSPESCDVNVNRPSEGPRVLTTLCPVSSSYKRDRAGRRRVNAYGETGRSSGHETHVNFYQDTKVGVLDILLVAF